MDHQQCFLPFVERYDDDNEGGIADNRERRSGPDSLFDNRDPGG
jgi:hypothetical protein